MDDIRPTSPEMDKADARDEEQSIAIDLTPLAEQLHSLDGAAHYAHGLSLCPQRQWYFERAAEGLKKAHQGFVADRPAINAAAETLARRTVPEGPDDTADNITWPKPRRMAHPEDPPPAAAQRGLARLVSYRYAWRYGWRWSLQNLRLGGIRAALRQLALAYVLGFDGETCQRCGRRYLLWWAANDLYERVTGMATPKGDNAGGLFCLACFDRMAEERGIGRLLWVPRGDEARPDAPHPENRGRF